MLRVIPSGISINSLRTAGTDCRRFLHWLPTVTTVSLKTCILVKRSCPQWKPSTWFFLIHYARFCSCLHSQLGSRCKITWIAITFGSKSTWWIGCLPGSSQTFSLPPLALQIKPPFPLLIPFYFSFPFSLSLPAVGLWRTDCDTLWHGSRAKLCCASITCQYPNSRMSVRGLQEVPLDGLFLHVLGARLPTCLCSQVCISDLAALRSRYIIRMREALGDCVQWPLSSP